MGCWHHQESTLVPKFQFEETIVIYYISLEAFWGSSLVLRNLWWYGFEQKQCFQQWFLARGFGCCGTTTCENGETRRSRKHWKRIAGPTCLKYFLKTIVTLWYGWLANGYPWISFLQLLGCTVLITIQHHYSWCKILSTNGMTSHYLMEKSCATQGVRKNIITGIKPLLRTLWVVQDFFHQQYVLIITT